LAKGRIACRAVSKDSVIHFAAYTAAETRNAFQWARQPCANVTLHCQQYVQWNVSS